MCHEGSESDYRDILKTLLEIKWIQRSDPGLLKTGFAVAPGRSISSTCHAAATLPDHRLALYYGPFFAERTGPTVPVPWYS
jgi:hypothetical protein